MQSGQKFPVGAFGTHGLLRAVPLANCWLEATCRGGGGGGCVLGPAELPPLCDIPSGCCSFTGPWTVTRSSLRMLRRVAAFCRPPRPVLLLVSFPRSRSPVVGVLGLCWMWHGVPFACQRRPIIGVLRMCWLLPGSFDCFCCPHTTHPPPPRDEGWYRQKMQCPRRLPDRGLGAQGFESLFRIELGNQVL